MRAQSFPPFAAFYMHARAGEGEFAVVIVVDDYASIPHYSNGETTMYLQFLPPPPSSPSHTHSA